MLPMLKRNKSSVITGLARVADVSQFNAATMTRRTPNLELLPTDYLDIASEDAQRLQLKSGERVRIRSRYGEAIMPVRISSAVRPGEVFATFHTAEIFLNRLTSS